MPLQHESYCRSATGRAVRPPSICSALLGTGAQIHIDCARVRVGVAVLFVTATGIWVVLILPAISIQPWRCRVTVNCARCCDSTHDRPGKSDCCPSCRVYCLGFARADWASSAVIVCATCRDSSQTVNPPPSRSSSYHALHTGDFAPVDNLP